VTLRRKSKGQEEEAEHYRSRAFWARTRRRHWESGGRPRVAEIREGTAEGRRREAALGEHGDPRRRGGGRCRSYERGTTGEGPVPMYTSSEERPLVVL
jgi:hypothetical protein